MGIIARLAAVFMFAVVFTLPASAAMVSIMVVETGVKEGNNAGQYASLWEDGLLGVFFDEGHIVSNSNIMRFENMPSKVLPDELYFGYDEAVSGGADYFVLAILQFNNINGRLRPQTITMRMFGSGTANLIHEQNFPAGTGTSLDDEYRLAKEAARSLIPHIKD